MEVVRLRSNHHPCLKVESRHVIHQADSMSKGINRILGLKGVVRPPQHLIEERRKSNHLRSASRHDKLGSHLTIKTREVKHTYITSEAIEEKIALRSREKVSK
jgi:hypothetical protein